MISQGRAITGALGYVRCLAGKRARPMSSCGILNLAINHPTFNVANVSFEIYVNIDSGKKNTVLSSADDVPSREINIFSLQERFEFVQRDSNKISAIWKSRIYLVY